MKYEEWKQFLAESAANPISYSDVRQEYDAILAFLKQDILQKSGSKYVAGALELLANDVRDQLHDPDPYDKKNYAYFDRESGTQPNLEEERIDENALIDFAVLDYLWKNLKVPGAIGDFFDSKGGKSVNDKIDDWFKNNMGNPLVRGLYKSMMLMGSPPDRYRHDKNWEREQQADVSEGDIAYEDLTQEQLDMVVSYINEKKVNK